MVDSRYAPTMQAQDLSLLVTRSMPFGKYQGRLIADLPGYTDAYDVMGRVLLDQGEPKEAINALRKAAELTPNSVARQVKLGLMSFYFGDPAEALDSLGRAVRLGISSKTFDLQGLTLLAALQFDRADERGYLRIVFAPRPMERIEAEVVARAHRDRVGAAEQARRGDAAHRHGGQWHVRGYGGFGQFLHADLQPHHR